MFITADDKVQIAVCCDLFTTIAISFISPPNSGIDKSNFFSTNS